MFIPHPNKFLSLVLPHTGDDDDLSKARLHSLWIFVSLPLTHTFKYGVCHFTAATPLL